MPYSIASPIVRLPEFVQFTDDDEKNIKRGLANNISEPLIAVNNSTAKPGFLSGVKYSWCDSNQPDDNDKEYELQEIKVGEKTSSPDKNLHVIKNQCSPKKKILMYSSLGTVGALASIGIIAGIKSYKTHTAVNDNKVPDNFLIHMPDKNYTDSLDQILAALKCSEYTPDDKQIRPTIIPVTEDYPKINLNDIHSMVYSGQINSKLPSGKKSTVDKNELSDKINSNENSIKNKNHLIDTQASCLYEKIDIFTRYPAWEVKYVNNIMHEVELLGYNIDRHLNKEGGSIESAHAHKQKIKNLNDYVLNHRKMLQEEVGSRFDISDKSWELNMPMPPLAELNEKLYEINDLIDDYIFAKKTDAEVSKKYQAVNNIIRSSERRERLAELENAIHDLKKYITENSLNKDIKPKARNIQLKSLFGINLILKDWNDKISQEQKFYSPLVDYFNGGEGIESKRRRIVNSIHDISACIHHLRTGSPKEGRDK
ncbi:hypothetical protein [Kalamiella sp. sgz302252]|uniref:hypothetical protein n=1 Tax=Pantoea sp. sgz302252 TaxID=3341827 RepID=UPI0036D39B58